MGEGAGVQHMQDELVCLGVRLVGHHKLVVRLASLPGAGCSPPCLLPPINSTRG